MGRAHSPGRDAGGAFCSSTGLGDSYGSSHCSHPLRHRVLTEPVPWVLTLPPATSQEIGKLEPGRVVYLFGRSVSHCCGLRDNKSSRNDHSQCLVGGDGVAGLLITLSSILQQQCGKAFLFCRGGNRRARKMNWAKSTRQVNGITGSPDLPSLA